jgi:hypothetical protein
MGDACFMAAQLENSMAKAKESTLDQYLNTPAGRESARMARERNPMSGLAMADTGVKIIQNYIKIFNLRPILQRVPMGHHGEFVVPACKPGFRSFPDPKQPCVYHLEECEKRQSYSEPLLIQSLYQFTTFDPFQDSYQVLPVDVVKGEAVAKNILNPPGSGYDTNLLEQGCFATMLDIPSEDELNVARAKLEKKYHLLYNEGEALEMQALRKEISNSMREAAAYLGKNPPWFTSQEIEEKCPGCGDSINSVVRVHGCGYVKDWKWAVENGMRTLEQVPEAKRWKGFPAPKSVSK